jgi:microcystin-dependent protein
MDSFIGEIRAFPYTFVPRGWVQCNGQSLPINQFQALFTIIGETYGGDNQTFKVPNFQGAALIGVGTNSQSGNTYAVNQQYGAATITLTNAALPNHTHDFKGKGGSDASRTSAPSTEGSSYLTNISYKRPSDTSFLGAPGYLNVSQEPVALHPAAIANSIPNSNVVAPHENRSPFQAIRYCICVFDGEFPNKPQ